MKTKKIALMLSLIVISSFKVTGQTSKLAQQASITNIPSYVPSNNLVGWWPFNGNANDQSGNLHNGVVNGASLTTDRMGNANTAYSFNGVSNSITLGNIINPAIQNAITISAWFNPAALINSINTYSGIDIGKKPVNHISLRVVNTSILKFQCMHGQPSPPNLHYVSVMSDNDFIANQWYHLVAIYKNNEAHLYVNGVEQTLLSTTGNLLNTIPSTSELFFGKSYQDSYVQYFYKGKLDDIGIWNRELTACEIMRLYNGGTNTSVISPLVASTTSNSQVQFSAQVPSGTAFVLWQTNPLNLGWQNIINNQSYSGANTNNLIINNVQLSNHGQAFRIITSSGQCSDTSNIAFIAISDTCINIVNDTNYIAVTDTLIINFPTGLPAPNITNTIQVFPNPANDHIVINYGNLASVSGFTLKITNSLGQIVFTTLISQQSSYIDLSTWSGAGIYFIHIINPQNNTIDIRKIVLK